MERKSTQNTSLNSPRHQLPVKLIEQKDRNEYEKTPESENPPPLPNSSPPLNILAQYVGQNEYEEPYMNNNTISKTTEAKRPTQLGNVSFVDSQECITLNSLYLDNNLDSGKPFAYTTQQEYEEITPIEEYKVSFPVTESDLEPSTLILMTQPSVDGSNIPESPSKPVQFTDLATYENDDDFKVNIVKYDFQRNYSLSEDELSTEELDNEEINSITEYTSQADSIYFGKDMEQPKLQSTKISSATNKEKSPKKNEDNEEINTFTSSGYTSQAASIFFGVNTEQSKPQSKKLLLQKATSDEEDC